MIYFVIKKQPFKLNVYVVVYQHIHSAGYSPRCSDHYSLPLMGRGGRKTKRTTLQQKNILSFK